MTCNLANCHSPWKIDTSFIHVDYRSIVDRLINDFSRSISALSAPTVINSWPFVRRIFLYHLWNLFFLKFSFWNSFLSHPQSFPYYRWFIEPWNLLNIKIIYYYIKIFYIIIILKFFSTAIPRDFRGVVPVALDLHVVNSAILIDRRRWSAILKSITRASFGDCFQLLANSRGDYPARRRKLSVPRN